jgi:hypothetical protein
MKPEPPVTRINFPEFVGSQGNLREYQIIGSSYGQKKITDYNNRNEKLPRSLNDALNLENIFIPTTRVRT